MLELDQHPSGRHYLQIPGPSPVPDRVLRAMSLPTIDHRGPEFGALGRRILHGLGDHAGRYEHVGRALAERGFAAQALDLPGHGTSSGRRGHIDSWDEYRAAVSAWMDRAHGERPDRRWTILGQSMGALVALDWALDHPDRGTRQEGAERRLDDPGDLDRRRRPGRESLGEGQDRDEREPADRDPHFVEPAEHPDARGLGVDPLATLEANDSYPLLDALGALIRTGKTGTNLNDLVVGLVYHKARRTRISP